MLAVAAAVVLVTGLAASRGTGTLSDVAGGVLYAALVHLLVLLAVPRARVAVAAGTALGVCVAVELAQLTGVPAVLSTAWPPAAYVLGSTFVVTDLLAYALGVVVVTAADAGSGRRAGRSDLREPGTCRPWWSGRLWSDGEPLRRVRARLARLR